MKNFSLIIVYVLFMQLHLIAQVRPHPAISPVFFGMNAWMPKYVGDTTNCPGLLSNPQILCKPNGTLHSHWADVNNSGAQIMRFGGITADENKPILPQYKHL